MEIKGQGSRKVTVEAPDVAELRRRHQAEKRQILDEEARKQKLMNDRFDEQIVNLKADNEAALTALRSEYEDRLRNGESEV